MDDVFALRPPAPLKPGSLPFLGSSTARRRLRYTVLSEPLRTADWAQCRSGPAGHKRLIGCPLHAPLGQNGFPQLLDAVAQANETGNVCITLEAAVDSEADAPPDDRNRHHSVSSPGGREGRLSLLMESFP